MQFPGQAKPAVGVLFDCYVGRTIDEFLAMALLYGLDGKNECRVISLTVSNPSLKAAAAAEAVSRFYAGAASGAFNFPGRALPVGLLDKGTPLESPLITVPLAKTTPEGTPVYSHGINKLTDTADPRAVIRNALTGLHDANGIVVAAGPLTNLAGTLGLKGAPEWIEKKVRYLTVTAGSFNSPTPEHNIKADIAAARKVLAEWPSPIVFAPVELGAQVPFPGDSIEKDFAWSPAHPVVDAYKAFQPMPYDAPTTYMAAVLHSVRPNEKYFNVSEPGTVTVRDDGAVTFTAGANGKHRYITVDPSQKDRIIKTYIELASAKPVVRQPRRRPPQQQEQQQQPPKKPDMPLVPPPAQAKPPAATP